jgi:hypothetical protein
MMWVGWLVGNFAEERLVVTGAVGVLAGESHGLECIVIDIHAPLVKLAA